jgi:hypothetical protein
MAASAPPAAGTRLRAELDGVGGRLARHRQFNRAIADPAQPHKSLVPPLANRLRRLVVVEGIASQRDGDADQAGRMGQGQGQARARA